MKLISIPPHVLPAYKEQLADGLQQKFEALVDAELSSDAFSFYTSVASVYSSRIEDEDIELDSYIKHKRDNVSFAPDYTKKTDDLYAAYTYAKDHTINKATLSEAHRLLSQNLLAENLQGKYRTNNMYVATKDGKIEYVAASPFVVEQEMDMFLNDVDTLLSSDISFAEVLYYASMVHLVFVKIHPWNDGNGRCGRLLEKWFIAQKLGEKAWYLQSEKHYYQNQLHYYQNLRALGLEYETLDYSLALPFTLMLTRSL